VKGGSSNTIEYHSVGPLSFSKGGKTDHSGKNVGSIKKGELWKENKEERSKNSICYRGSVEGGKKKKKSEGSMRSYQGGETTSLTVPGGRNKKNFIWGPNKKSKRGRGLG